MTRELAPYGSWRSPIAASALATGSVRLSEVEMAERELWWIEGRPAEGGRRALMRARLDGSAPGEAISPRFSVRTRVHEYGGGSYALRGHSCWFSDDAEGRLHRADLGGEWLAVTPPPATPRAWRFADIEVTADGRRVYCVRETHTEGHAPRNEVVCLGTDWLTDVTPVLGGRDFYAAPRVSPDGSTLAWLTWDHPRMPWVGSELWRAAIDPATGMVDATRAERVAGGESESVVQPAWSRAGALHWVSDRNGWWNLYREGQPLYPAELEFGAPLWTFGQQMYAFLDDGRIVCAWIERGESRLGVLDPERAELTQLDVDYVPVVREARIRASGRTVAYVGATPTRAPAVVAVDCATGEQVVVARSVEHELEPGHVALPEAVEYQSRGRSAHAFFYPPRNAGFQAPAGELPPLVVMGHGGPTGQTEPVLDLETQFWTSRGFAVADVNYAGSTGYGRAYRDLLAGNWGRYDVEDCAEAALHLARTGRVDPERLIIRGSSAGGYTALCALAFSDVFRAGAVYYGVADLAALFAGTHKFESHYDAWLVAQELMAERSPINSVDRIDAPVIFFQGLEDEVVPPEQSELIVRALAERGIEHEYRTYAGEGHGFRRAETIADSLEAELAFYGRVLGFAPAP